MEDFIDRNESPPNFVLNENTQSYKPLGWGANPENSQNTSPVTNTDTMVTSNEGLETSKKTDICISNKRFKVEL